MKLSEIELPSNRKFGFFLTFVSMATMTYLFFATYVIWAYGFAVLALVFLFITLVMSDALLPLNKLWMRLGFLMGLIVSPIVLGIIFFGMITPTAILLRLAGRDELRLEFGRQASYWKLRSETIKPESFKHQF